MAPPQTKRRVDRVPAGSKMKLQFGMGGQCHCHADSSSINRRSGSLPYRRSTSLSVGAAGFSFSPVPLQR
jgi:hypothetical protein